MMFKKRSAEKDALLSKIHVLEEEIEKSNLNFAEAEEALEELKTIRESERTVFAQINNNAHLLLDQLPGIEGASKEALHILEESLNHLESLQLPEAAPLQIPEPTVPAPDDDAERVAEGIRLADDLKMKVHEGSVQANASRELITAIAEDIKKITEMAETIRHISAQTNILSMNADIESAHAGAAGVGFAVVAEEIKRLAESTAANTKQIQGEIKAITEKTRDGVKAGEASFRTMEELGKKTEEMESLLHSLASLKPKAIESAPLDLPVQNQDALDSLGANLEELKAEYRFGHERIKTELETIDRQIGKLRLSLETTAATEPFKPEETVKAAAPPPESQISDSKDVTVKEPPRTVI
jgi:methyl-accepting chemotaxis protein